MSRGKKKKVHREKFIKKVDESSHLCLFSSLVKKKPLDQCEAYLDAGGGDALSDRVYFI